MIERRRVYERKEIGGLVEIDCFLKLRRLIRSIIVESFAYEVKFFFVVWRWWFWL